MHRDRMIELTLGTVGKRYFRHVHLHSGDRYEGSRVFAGSGGALLAVKTTPLFSNQREAYVAPVARHPRNLMTNGNEFRALRQVSSQKKGLDRSKPFLEWLP